jgi:hypothetical protein
MGGSYPFLSCGRALLALFPLLLPAQNERIPTWWFSSAPEQVLADPEFQTLSLAARAKILEQVDPKFSRMNSGKRERYIWDAEIKYLPKADPKDIYPWRASEPCCSTGLGGPGTELTKTITAREVTVEASIARSGFFRAHVRISNGTGAPVSVRPSTFLLSVVKPKALALSFNYPERVSYEYVRAAVNQLVYMPMQQRTVVDNSGRTLATIQTPDIAAAQAHEANAQTLTSATLSYSEILLRNALRQTELSAGGTVEGDVYFFGYSKQCDLMLRVFVADAAFDFPFSVPRE